MFWLFLIFLTSSFALDANQTQPILPSGGNLIIDIVKRNSSELSRTILSEPQIILFAGTAPLPPEDGTSGELVPFSPFDGCGPLIFDPKYHFKNSKGNPEFMSSSNSTNFVVLIKKSKNCGYGDIFKQVSQVPHVTGVLVYDPVEDPPNLDTLELFDSNIHVPGFLISTPLGEDLLKKVSKYREGVTKNSNDPWVSATLVFVPVKVNLTKAFQVLLVVVVVILILSLIVSLLMNYTFYQGGRSDWNSVTPPPPPPQRKIEDIEINDEFIEKIPFRVYQPSTSPVDLKEQGSEQNEQDIEDYRRRHTHNDSCPVCIEEFKSGETVRQLHCGHCYHPHCITPWLKTRSPLCPLCKIDVRASMIEAEELAFVRQLRKLEVIKKNQVVIEESEKLKNSECEMKEVCVVSASTSLRPRQTSFESIALENSTEK